MILDKYKNKVEVDIKKIKKKLKKEESRLNKQEIGNSGPLDYFLRMNDKLA